MFGLKLIFFVFFFVVLFFADLNGPPWASGSEILEQAPIYLTQGEQRLLNIPKLKRFSLGSAKVRARGIPGLSADQILIKGIDAGSSDLWVWKADGQQEHRLIQIMSSGTATQELPLLHALSHLNEVEVLFFGSGVTLRGQIRTLQEAANVAALTRSFPNLVTNETEIGESLLQKGRSAIQNWLASSRFKDTLRLEEIEGTLLVSGSAPTPSARAGIEQKVHALFPLARLELEALPDNARTIYFRVFLLEIKKDQLSSLGIDWPGRLDGAFQVSPTAIRSNLQLEAGLKMLSQNGLLKVLSKPELAVRAPGEAELFAGGELPIHMQSHFYSNISWKSFGLTLKLKVAQVAGEKVRLDIQTEVSHLDATLASDKIPGLRANRMKTQVDAHFGTPLLLSGLLQEDLRTQAKGLPWLKQIPVLGALFGSEDYLNERSELVAILLPHSSLPAAPMSRVAETQPKGPIPPPRNWLSAEQTEKLKQSPDYPWNVWK